MEQAEDVASLAPVPVFIDDTGRRRKLTRRVGRVLLVGFTAYIGLLLMGFARDPRLGALHLPTIGLPDLGLMIPPAPLVLGEQTTRSPSAGEIEVSTAGASDGDVRSAPPSGGRPVPNSGSGTGTPGFSTSPSVGTAAAPGSVPTGRPVGSSTTTSTSTTTITRPGGNSPTSTTTTTTAPSTPSTTSPTTPGQGPVSAKGPDGSGPPGYGTEAPGQQRKTTTTTSA